MKVIITGGTGMIGTALSKALVKEGYTVVVLTRSPERHAPQAGVQFVAWDGRTTRGWGELVDGAGAVINLAGENLAGGRWTPARKQAILDSRTQAGQAVTQAIAAAHNKPAMLLQASAVGYYPTGENQVYEEGDRAGDGFESQVVRAWEVSTEGVDALGVKRYVMRIAVVLANQGGALPRMLLPFKLFAGGPLGSGRQPVAWIHLDDLVDAMLFFLKNAPPAGIYNLAAPENVTNAQFGKVIGKVMGRPYWAPAPAFAIRLAFGEMASVVLEGRRVASQKLQAAGFHFRYPSIESALRQLLSGGMEKK